MRLAFAVFFFFNDTATTEIYTLSLHDALPISSLARTMPVTLIALPKTLAWLIAFWPVVASRTRSDSCGARSEEHTSELQSRQYLVCRLLLEKKKHKQLSIYTTDLQCRHTIHLT